MNTVWETRWRRQKYRRQALTWLTVAAVLLVILCTMLVSAPIVRQTETEESIDTATETAEVIYVVTSTPEPLDCWGMTSEERGIVERVVEQEARGESYLGQMAVAQCIRTAAVAEGISPYEVVMEDGQYADPALEASDSVKQAVQAVLYDGEDAVAADIRYFYAPEISGESSWHENQLEYVCDIGNHRFFSAKEEDNG